MKCVVVSKRIQREFPEGVAVDVFHLAFEQDSRLRKARGDRSGYLQTQHPRGKDGLGRWSNIETAKTTGVANGLWWLPAKGFEGKWWLQTEPPRSRKEVVEGRECSKPQICSFSGWVWEFEITVKRWACFHVLVTS